MKDEARIAIDNFLERYITFICSHPRKIVLGAFLTAFLALYFTSKLQIKTDFVELLPAYYRSVDDINRLTERVGGFGNLTIVIETEDLVPAQQFADDLARKIRSDLPEGYIRYIGDYYESSFPTPLYSFRITPSLLITFTSDMGFSIVNIKSNR